MSPVPKPSPVLPQTAQRSSLSLSPTDSGKTIVLGRALGQRKSFFYFDYTTRGPASTSETLLSFLDLIFKMQLLH